MAVVFNWGRTQLTANARRRFNEVLCLVQGDLAILGRSPINCNNFEWITYAETIFSEWDRKQEKNINAQAQVSLTKREVSTSMYCSPVNLTSSISRTNASIRNVSTLTKRGFMEMSCSTSSLSSLESKLANHINQNHNLIYINLHLQHIANVVVPHTDVLHT
jgi:hypothetical protein